MLAAVQDRRRGGAHRHQEDYPDRRREKARTRSCPVEEEKGAREEEANAETEAIYRRRQDQRNTGVTASIT